MTIHRMDFKTVSVHPGLNQTIRGGNKWLKARPGDRLDICAAGSDISESAVNALVVASQSVTVNELDSLLPFSHVPGAREWVGLDTAMCAAYGSDWHNGPIVIVWFWVAQ